MQFGDLVSIYGTPSDRGDRGRGRGMHRGRGSGRGRGRGGYQHQERSFPSAPVAPQLVNPPASHQPFAFGLTPNIANDAVASAAAAPPPPLPPVAIVQPELAGRFYQRPQGPPRPPKKKGKYGCDTCGQYFEFESLLQAHIDGHEQCTHPGCTFRAAPKLVAAHAIIHTRAIPSLNTPEEIARYRAERRKNFPTDANIQRKQEEEAEKRKRGELPPADAGSKRGRRGRGNHSSSWSTTPRYAAPQPVSAPPPAAAAAATTAAPITPALAALSAYANSDDEAPPETSAKQPVAPNPALEEGEISTTAENSNKPAASQSRRRCPYMQHGTCKRKDCHFSHEPLPPRVRPPTLLQKVYEKDIRREHSAALQCLRYIVQNNFLQ